LSGSGKSTLADKVVTLLKNKGLPVIHLDGDKLRDVFGSSKLSRKNHTRKSRISLAMQYAHLCQIISSQGVTVVISTISMFNEVHNWNRINLKNYVEVFLKVPLKELRRRDPKGIYHRYDTGKLKNVAGLDLLVDEPKTPDWLFDFNLDKQYTVKYMANKIIKNL
jgi:cytidine diphosphoramidate kinase